MSDCIFCKIIDGEIPSAKVYEDENIIAFLDISQVTPGHTLIVPKRHVANIFEYDDEIATIVATKIPVIARAIRDAFPESLGMNIINNNGEAAYQTVFHTHWHLVPRYGQGDGLDIRFANHADDYNEEEFKQRASMISQLIESEE